MIKGQTIMINNNLKINNLMHQLITKTTTITTTKNKSTTTITNTTTMTMINATITTMIAIITNHVVIVIF